MKKWTLVFFIFLCFSLLIEGLVLATSPHSVALSTLLEKTMLYLSQNLAPVPLKAYLNKQDELDFTQTYRSKQTGSNKESLQVETTRNGVQQVIDTKAPIKVNVQNLSHIRYERFQDSKPISHFEPPLLSVFPYRYSELDGLLTFRGNHYRSAPSFGVADIQEGKLKEQWSYTTKRSSWGGGAGWTGQPAIVRWPKEMKRLMNLNSEFIEQEDFVEVIYASLDGNIYFFDLESGTPSRAPLPIHNPIKGSVSVDPRGYPLLYVGEGIPEQKRISFGLYSLIDFKKLHSTPGNDSLAPRSWGAFDGSALINRDTDTLYVGGENGLIYALQLNTHLNVADNTLTVHPETLRYRYRMEGLQRQGIENSLAAYKNLIFFSDNSGSIQALDLQTMTPIWALPPTDDTDASITIEVENDIPYLYTGTEVDLQGTQGNARLRKINGITGEVLWEVHYHCYSDPNINGGILATNVVGKQEIERLAIFTIARYNTFNAGLMVALDKQTGTEVWRWEMPHYAWSSPVDLYTAEGKAYLIQADSAGNLTLLHALTGEIVNQLSLGANIEASPAVFDSMIVVATRGQKIYGIKVE